MEGRYILVNSLVGGVEVSLVNTHLMKKTQIRVLLKVMIQHSSGLLLIGKDCGMSQLMDEQPPSKPILSKMSRMLEYQSTEVDLADIKEEHVSKK